MVTVAISWADGADSTLPLPSFETSGSAGADLRANLSENMRQKGMLLEANSRMLVSTGFHLEIPKDYEAQIRPRSGLALNKGITVINSPGTIDADYRGEIGVILINLSDSSFQINSGDRIAQMIIAKHETISWRVVEKLDKSDRGNKGFGSTGV